MSRTLERLGINLSSITERIELIGEIWDSLSEAHEDSALPDGHRLELERRRLAAEADPRAGIPWRSSRLV
ncbi:MAG: addiction module protein [Isosphaeraceae bacterium]|nr:addiction module protein [Isosphaeraceae bacterium]